MEEGKPAMQVCPIRAAQYVRMSMEHQQCSTENQLDAIARYADAHGLEIARTYNDGLQPRR
jgi:DNA invertase Pin-like site-specific DNA recombinase